MKTGGIEINPKIMVGQPVIAGTRIPVYIIIDLLADGQTDEEIIRDYPRLTKSDIQTAVNYAAKAVSRVSPNPTRLNLI